MKKIILFQLLFSFVHISFAQVGIGTIDIDKSALLEVKSSNRGFLAPRMTANQKALINDPSEGLIVYCLDCCTNGNLIFYNGSRWHPSMTEETCADFDLDGIPDITDVDDDNDGILDEDEEEFIVNGQLTNSIDGWTVANNVIHSTWDGLNGMSFGGGQSTGGTASQTAPGVIPGSTGQLSFYIRKRGSGNGAVSIRLFINGIQHSDYSTTNANAYTLRTANIGPINSTSLTIRFDDITTNGTAKDIYLNNLSLTLDNPQDLDGDGFGPNRDLDIDGDNCFDAVEGGNSVMVSDLYPFGNIKGEVNAVGLPLLVTGGQTLNYANDPANQDTDCL